MAADTFRGAAGRVSLIKLLLERGADPQGLDRAGQTPLHFAAQRGHAEIVKWLIGRQVDVNAIDLFRNTPLLLASARSDEQTLQLLCSIMVPTCNVRTKMDVSARYCRGEQ